MDRTTYTTAENDWVIVNKQGGHERFGTLTLSWEVHCTSMSDDYTPTEIDAGELLRRWLQRYYPDTKAEKLYGPGMASIYWSVGMPQNSEPAPFCADVVHQENFLTHFEWPVSRITGERVNWNRVPVVDRSWTEDRADKGGFFQQATGWRPSPMQPVVYVPGVLAAAGLPGLVIYSPRQRP